MNLKENEENLKQVIDVYVEKFKIKNDQNWFILLEMMLSNESGENYDSNF